MATRTRILSAASRHTARRRGLFKAARRRDRTIDAVLVSNAYDVRYLTGLLEGVRYLLIARGGGATIFTFPLFADRVASVCPEAEIKAHTDPDPPVLREVLASCGAGKVGFQPEKLTVAQHGALTEALGGERLISMEGLIDGQRSVKDDVELRLTRKCVRIAEEAFKEVAGRGAAWIIGKTEREVAAELEYRMRLLGADRQGFQQHNIIIASGPNSYTGHHLPTARKIKAGEAVLFDWGAELDGYRSDITRMVFTGAVPERLREMYGHVRRAHDAAIAAIRPGVTTRTLQRVAVDILEPVSELGHFRHGLGHGMGLEIHEYPFMSLTRPPVPLREGMVITIEPGLYREKVGGVRLESDVLVTKTGHQMLTTLSLDLNASILR